MTTCSAVSTQYRSVTDGWTDRISISILHISTAVLMNDNYVAKFKPIYYCWLHIKHCNSFNEEFVDTKMPKPWLKKLKLNVV